MLVEAEQDISLGYREKVIKVSKVIDIQLYIHFREIYQVVSEIMYNPFKLECI